jgi:hypothetical protein
MGIIKNYHDKKWTLQFLDALYNSIDIIENWQNNIILHIKNKTQNNRNLFSIKLHIFKHFT